jgi:hypothetical protein
MRRYFFELLAAILLLSSLGFFYACIGSLARHDYIAAALLSGIGFVVIHVGAEMARLALAHRS